MKLSVAEFRKNMREAFNAAERGEKVEIHRHGKVFLVMHNTFAGKFDTGLDMSIPEKNNRLATPTPDLLGEIPPRPKDGDTPVRTDEEWKEAEALERACCKAKKPCQHWHWVFERGLWVNELSHRERGEE